MTFAFVHTTLPLGRHRPLQHEHQPRPSPIRAKIEAPVTPTRRQILNVLPLLPFAPFLVQPANADRTGKYSTKLTAKRRYLPRIVKGFELLRAAESPGLNGNWQTATTEFTAVVPNLISALRLFATSFFAEGNRIGQTEKALAVCVDDLELAAKSLAAAADKNDRSAAALAYGKAAKAANCYIQTAKLKETVDLLAE